MFPIKPESSKRTQLILEKARQTENMDAKFGKSLSIEENQIRHFILKRSSVLGRTPTIREVKNKFRQYSENKIQDILIKLDRLDVIHLNNDKTIISAAYPFSASFTPHLVTIHEEEYNPVFAMCAIDALGVGFMFNSDVTINSQCACCQEKITIEIKTNKITVLSPETTVIWGDMNYSCCAATSICQNINFFSSTNHFKVWEKGNPQGQGVLLQIQEALYLGKMFFEKRLEA